MCNDKPYKIKGKYMGHTEELAEAETQEQANRLLEENIAIYGANWNVWIDKER